MELRWSKTSKRISSRWMQPKYFKWNMVIWHLPSTLDRVGKHENFAYTFILPSDIIWHPTKKTSILSQTPNSRQCFLFSTANLKLGGFFIANVNFNLSGQESSMSWCNKTACGQDCYIPAGLGCWQFHWVMGIQLDCDLLSRFIFLAIQPATCWGLVAGWG